MLNISSEIKSLLMLESLNYELFKSRIMIKLHIYIYIFYFKLIKKFESIKAIYSK